MPKKAFLANTLGYIYYYGRCNNGNPEYELAYKYASMRIKIISDMRD